MGQTIDPLRLMQRVTDRTLELIRAANGVMVGLADEHGVTYVSAAGNQATHIGTRVELDSSLSGLAMRTGLVQRSDDTEADARVDREACRRLSVASLLCIPLRRKSETVGVLAVNADQPHAFADADVDTLSHLAEFISVVIGSAADLAGVKEQLLALSDQADTAVDATRYVLGVLSPETITRIDSVQRIHAVLDNPDTLGIVFQPIVDLTTNTMTAVEALARFETTPYRPPNVWFAEAHRHDLGVELEMLAITKAAEQMPLLPDGVDLTINAGPHTVVSPQFREAEVHPTSRIILELTEHTVVDDYPRLVASLHAMRRSGVRIAVDDTGAGYSSLTHILRLAPDFIKLDRDLVNGIDIDPVRRALATSLITFASSTGSRIIAEGVEDQAELDVLRELGVTYAQGYHLGHPVPIEQLRTWQPLPTGFVSA